MELGQESGTEEAGEPHKAASAGPDSHLESGPDEEHPMVVGIGASAGGLAALKQFLVHVPEHTGLAFVVVVHLSPRHESHLADLLQPHSEMPVRQVTETMPLEPDHVYVIPPGANLNTIDTHLRLSELEEHRRERAPIDHFFRTLAETNRERAIGIILTGTGSDGTLGLREIKEKGGLTIVQDPREAEFEGMPQNAIARGLVDLVLPLDEMATHILQFARTEPRVPVPGEGQELPEESRAVLQKIFGQIRPNEELRSTLEELETSQEELQSMNEELQTVNQENRHKVEELSQLSSDLQNLLSATDIATLFLDRNLRIMRFTPRVGELFNVRLSDRGRPLSDLTHRLGNHELEGDAREVLDRLVPLEREIRSVDGRWYLVRVLPYRAAEDRIDGIVVTFVEITLLKTAEEAFRKSEERYRLLMENVKEYAIFMMDSDGRIAAWNTGAERVFGHTEQEAVGQTAAIIFTDEDREAGAPEIEMEQAARTGEAADERWHVRRDGSRFWGSGVMVALHHSDGGLRGFAKVLRDNTERKEAEDRLRSWNEELEERVRRRTEQVRALASTLTMAEQGERRRISQVLHDNLQQILYGIQMKLSFIRKDVETGDIGQIRTNAEEADGWLSDAIRTTRQLTIDLSPPVLQGEGLIEALKWLASQMKDLHHLDVKLEADRTAHVPGEEMRVLLFQIIRELLFNVAKHARTDCASVALREENHQVVIHVVDHGRGIDLEGLDAEGGGFGLFHARERLGLFGGRMDVATGPEGGTHVTIYVPVDESAEGYADT